MISFPFWKISLAAMWIKKWKQQIRGRKSSPESVKAKLS